MTQQIEQFFQSYRSPTWMLPQQTLAQEEDIGSTNVQPTGWVINSSANVFIDDEGLHVFDGSIFLNDLAGDSVLTPSGFAGSWVEYIRHGVYNGEFNSPVTDNSGLTATTIVGGADTTDEYLASLSPNLPNWVIGTRTGNVTYGRSTIAGITYFSLIGVAPGTGTSTVEIFQDVPIVAHQPVSVEAFLNHASVTSGEFRIKYQWADADHGLIGTKNDISTILSIAGSDSNVNLSQPSDIDYGQSPLEPPVNAKFVRIYLYVSAVLGTGGTVDINSLTVKQDPLVSYQWNNNHWNAIGQWKFPVGIRTEGWTSVNFLNSWVNFDSANQPTAQYMKDSEGFVHLKGLVKNGTVGSGFPIFTLPASHRPTTPGTGAVHFAVASNSALGIVRVSNAGNVDVLVGSNVWVDLSGVVFWRGLV